METKSNILKQAWLSNTKFPQKLNTILITTATYFINIVSVELDGFLN